MATRLKLTKDSVGEIQAADAEQFIWDTDQPGFGMRVWPSGRMAYIAQYRLHGGRGGRQRRVTVGKHPEMDPGDARKLARKIIAKATLGTDAAAERDKARKADTVSDLVDVWLEEAAHISRRTGESRTATNVAGERGRIDAHVRPQLGKRRLMELQRRDIERFRDAVARGATRRTTKTKLRGRAVVRGGAGTAARTVRMLSSIFAFAIDLGLMPENPCKGVRLNPTKAMERFLSGEELQRLGVALAGAEAAGVHSGGLNIIRLLALTGARKTEIAALEWSSVDFERECLRLKTSKTGAKVIQLAPPALTILTDIERQKGSDYVFPAARGKGHFDNVGKVWVRVRERAGLDDVRLHDLRHTFASFGATGGFGLPVIGALLGHRQAATTARYAHLADDPLRRAAARIGGEIGAAMAQRATK